MLRHQRTNTCKSVLICLIFCWSNFTLHYIMDGLKRDETTFKLSKLIEDNDTSIKELRNKLEGYYTCTILSLEIIN